MPLRGYLQKLDPGRISSIGTVVGDKTRRRRIVPNTHGSEESVYVNIYTRDCLSHKPMGAVASVILMRLIPGKTWEELGVAKCCPLCWKILIKPDSVELPDAVPLPKPRVLSTLQRSTLSANRKRKQSKKDRAISPLHETVENFIANGEEFTLQDLMEVSGKSRNACRSVVMRYVKAGRVKIEERGGAGLGMKTQYISA